MAQLQTLKDRESGQTVYPITSTEAVFDENGVNLKTLLLNQKQSIENALKDYPKKTDVTQSLEGKQDKLSPTTDIYITNDNIIGLSAEFKNSKLDKSDWDARNDKFTIRGKGISQINGQLFSDPLYSATEFIPINRNYDITVIARTTPTSAALALYNRSQELIGCRSLSADTIGNVELDTVTNTYTLHSADIPTEAMYFRCGSSINQPNRTYSNGPTNESRTGAISNAIADSKYALFCDLYNAAFKVGNTVYGKYDHENAPDATHVFRAYDLWLTYEEAMAVMNLPVMNPSNLRRLYHDVKTARTHRPILSYMLVTSGDNTFNGASFEVIEAGPISCGVNLCRNCTLLRRINVYSINNNTQGQNLDSWTGCSKLEDIGFGAIYRRSFSLKDSPLLSLATMQQIASKTAAEGEPFTITVHPDVYAKLTGDTTNEAAAALTPEELVQWQQVLTDAVAKNISFATV